MLSCLLTILKHTTTCILWYYSDSSADSLAFGATCRHCFMHNMDAIQQIRSSANSLTYVIKLTSVQPGMKLCNIEWISSWLMKRDSAI